MQILPAEAAVELSVAVGVTKVFGCSLAFSAAAGVVPDIAVATPVEGTVLVIVQLPGRCCQLQQEQLDSGSFDCYVGSQAESIRCLQFDATISRHRLVLYSGVR